ncbi:flagellar export protein FliJ [Xylophilus sp. Leaf220]|uniref:flagellar export protein FliJ n=1 Tax=Xylophilus sp. Leaf220 TaxID=1735686 RepID=UPI000700BC3A|nr:flagellar export protein FliJ [Xylophilus sp. Leaf220]KQM69697.1 hypothetical protein ASE76_11110 [Xylophilus sp. Leaf220]
MVNALHGGLQVAIDLATRQRDQAAAQLSQARSAERGAQEQLDQLQTYAAEAESRWTLQAQVQASPELMQHHYQFMARLYQTVEMQRGVMAQHARQMNACALRLRDTELRLGSLQKVVARKHLEAERLQARRDQKDVDEFAAVQMRRLAAAPAFGGED